MPQIDFLIYLQNIRNYFGDSFDNFFLSITMFGEYLIPFLIISVIYWCIDMKKGMYLFLICSFNVFFVQLIKMTACIYRPWVLSSKIHPSLKAVSHAGGYSFPSGHSALSSTFLGGLAVSFKNKIVIFGLILLILLVGFSRMFLGVHTPQDVIIGFLTGVVCIFVFYPVVNWLEKDNKRYLPMLVITDILIILAVLYILKKPYPIDYFNHNILVMPQKAIYDTFINIGLVSGILNGLCLFRRFFNFTPENISVKKRVFLGTFGVIITYFSLNTIVGECFIIHQTYPQICVKTFFTGFFITFVYPFICNMFTNTKTQQK